MNKLIIFIPCYNEEKSLPITVRQIPKIIKNISKIDIIVVDDGSTDKTIEVAKSLNLKILKHNQHIGLSKIFNTIVKYFKSTNYDLMCILDADNQYKASDINILIKELLENNKDLVIGSRKIFKNRNMSFLKKFFQISGSKIVSLITNYNIPDVTSGFRLYKKVCFDNNFIIENSFSYTVESLIIFSWKKINLSSVYIDCNDEKLRPSRLFDGNLSYIKSQTLVILDNFIKYFPMKFFSFISALFFIPGLLISFRYLYFLINDIQGHVQSLILASILIISSIIFLVLGILSRTLSKIDFKINSHEKNEKNISNYEIIENNDL